MVAPLIPLEGWILQDSFHALAIRGLMPVPFVTPRAVSLGDLSAELWALEGQGWGGALLFSSLLPAPGSPEPRAGLCASVTHAQGCSLQCCQWNGTQPQPPAPLWHPGDCEGLFSYAGSGSDCSVLSKVSPKEFPSLQWNKTSLFLPFWMATTARTCGSPAPEPGWLPRGGSTAHSCCLPLGGIARVSSLCTFPVAAMLGLSRHQAWGTAGSSSSAVGQALSQDQDNRVVLLIA